MSQSFTRETSVTLLDFNPQTLTDASTITWNVLSKPNAVVTIGATGRILSITNPAPGYTYTIKIIQDGSGSRTITTWPTGIKWPASTAPTLSTAAGAIDVIVFYYDGSNYFGSYQLTFG